MFQYTVKPVSTHWGQFRRRLLALPLEETGYGRRGFRGATELMRARLDRVGAVFLLGYHAALEHGVSEALSRELNEVESEWRGFAFEGVAMGLALLDLLTPWRRRRIGAFLQGAGEAHAYMIHVGIGWVWARMPFGFRRWQQTLDPLLGWLAFDGWGFHEGFFNWPKYINGQPAPGILSGYERRAFDQGLGRSFWFVNGGNKELIAQTTARFSTGRQSDLWGGIGLAATYAGGAGADLLTDLRDAAGGFQPELAQGAAFAAKARQRAGNGTEYTSLATEILCGLPAADAARLTDEALENLTGGSDVPAYEMWRRRIQCHFRSSRIKQLQST